MAVVETVSTGKVSLVISCRVGYGVPKETKDVSQYKGRRWVSINHSIQRLSLLLAMEEQERPLTVDAETAITAEEEAAIEAETVEAEIVAEAEVVTEAAAEAEVVKEDKTEESKMKSKQELLGHDTSGNILMEASSHPDVFGSNTQDIKKFIPPLHCSDESQTVAPDLKKVEASPKTKVNKDVEVVKTDTEKKIIEVAEAP